MSKRMYIAEDESWDVFFAQIGLDMESEEIEKETRSELSNAFQDVKELDASILKDLSAIVNEYYTKAHLKLQKESEQMEDPKQHIFYNLDRVRKFLATRTEGGR